MPHETGLFLLYFFHFLSQEVLFVQPHRQDSIMIRQIYDMALTQGKRYIHLERICKEVPTCLSRSANADETVYLTFAMLKKIKPDTVWLQPVMFPHWVRGSRAECKTINASKISNLYGVSSPLLCGVEVHFSITSLHSWIKNVCKQ